MNRILTLGEHPEVLGRIAYAATMTGQAIFRHFGDDERHGGYLYIRGAPLHPFLHLRVANPLPTRINNNYMLSMEKADRLARHPKHRLSWESRNPKEMQLGGAVRFPSNNILSFSGLPEPIDTPWTLSLGRFGYLADDEWVKETLDICGGLETYLEMYEMILHYTKLI